MDFGIIPQVLPKYFLACLGHRGESPDSSPVKVLKLGLMPILPRYPGDFPKGSLGGFLGAFWEHVWKIFCHLEHNAKIAKYLGRPIVFHRFLRIQEGPGARIFF